MVKVSSKLRSLLFLAVLFLPLIVTIRPILTVWDSMFIFIPFSLIMLVAYYPWPKPKLAKIGKEFEAILKEKQTFYFIRVIERVMGQKSYYIFCAVVSTIVFVVGYKLSVAYLLLTEPMSGLYVLASGRISLFFGLALWKPVTEGFSELVKGFYTHYKERKRKKKKA